MNKKAICLSAIALSLLTNTVAIAETTADAAKNYNYVTAADADKTTLVFYNSGAYSGRFIYSYWLPDETNPGTGSQVSDEFFYHAGTWNELTIPKNAMYMKISQTVATGGFTPSYVYNNVSVCQGNNVYLRGNEYILYIRSWGGSLNTAWKFEQYNDTNQSHEWGSCGPDNPMVYRGFDKKGGYKTIKENLPQLEDMFKGKLRSVAVPAGWTITLYDQENYQGNSISYTGNGQEINNFPNDMDKQVKSLKFSKP